MDGYEVFTEPGAISVGEIHEVLSRLYQCEAVPFDVFTSAVANSFNFCAVSTSGELAGYVRVVSDQAVLGFLNDAFVAEGHRGRGVPQLLIEAVMGHPALRSVQRFSLPAGHAKGFYERCAFSLSAAPAMVMEIVRPV